MNALELLFQNSSLRVNKNLAKKVGLNAAILYTYFLDKSNFEFFHVSKNDIENELTFSLKQQTRLVKQLENEGAIETKLSGIPAKKYYRVLPNFKILS
jgi:hypothetical protein